MIFKLFALMNFFIEIVIMIWEIRLNLKMKKLGIAEFQKLTEEDRRRKFGRKSTIYGWVSFALFIVILVLGLALAPGRSCHGSRGVETGVCVDCRDS